jgi:hypothetical protein
MILKRPHQFDFELSKLQATGSASGIRNGLPVIREESPFKCGTNQHLKGDNDGSF